MKTTIKKNDGNGKRLTRRTFIKWSGLGLGTLTLATFTGSPLVYSQPQKDTLRYVIQRVMPTWDRYMTTERPPIIMLHHFGDTLIVQDPYTAEFKPQLAKSWEWLDEETIEFKLNKGITFHNGEPFNAEAVKYTFEFYVDPEHKAPGREDIESIDHVEVVDDLTARLHLKYPDPVLMESLAKLAPIYPPKYHQDVGLSEFGEHPVGTGPYKFIEWEKGQITRMEKYENYFGGTKGQPKIDKLHVRVIPEPSTRLSALLAEEVDLIRAGLILPDQVSSIKDSPVAKIATSPILRIFFVWMDCQGRAGDHPITDVKVRRAINHAIDKKAITEEVLKGYAEPLSSACNPLQFGCTTEVTQYPYDPEKAKQLLTEAGYPNGFEIDFYGYRERPITEAIIVMLQSVGIKAKLQWFGGNWDAIVSRLRGGKIPILHMSWGSGSTFDVEGLLPYFFDADKPLTGFTTPRLDELLKKAKRTTNRAKREKWYNEALAIIADQAAWIPLYRGEAIAGLNAKLNFKPTPDEISKLWTAYWE